MSIIVGITIGPIVETISESKKISEIANASLFFSTIISQFLDKIKNEKDYNIITPNIEDNNKKEDKFYPDRIVLEYNGDKKENEILDELNDIYSKIMDMDGLFTLKEYVNFNIVAVRLEGNKTKEIFKHLDGIELVKNFPERVKDKKILEEINNYLKKRKTLDARKFKTTMGGKDEENNGYRAIVCLDLDNMGKFSQENIEDIKKVSKAIYNYIEKLNRFISKEKGLVLYSAGDDILAIINPKDIYSFIRYACETLQENFKGFGNKELSVSFGVFICYAKHPIKEAIQKAQELLFVKAKKTKNTASLLLQKHSGQSSELNFLNLLKNEKFNEDNRFFKYLSSIDLENENEGTQGRLLNTIVQKVSTNTFIFKNIVEDEEKINNYLSHLFDLKVEGKNQIEMLKNLLVDIGKNKEDKDDFNNKIREVLNFFRIMKFYVEKGKEGDMDV